MAVKYVTKQIDVESNHDGYLVITRNEENDDVWLEIAGDSDLPFIIETEKDINTLCDILIECKKLLKKL